MIIAPDGEACTVIEDPVDEALRTLANKFEAGTAAYEDFRNCAGPRIRNLEQAYGKDICREGVFKEDRIRC